jgi:hypothetical protein
MISAWLRWGSETSADTRAQLPSGPLSLELDLAAEQSRKIRIQTVHQVKGASIDAVLYAASRANIEAMLAGVDTEVGRIGYVAMTRAQPILAGCSQFCIGRPATRAGASRFP